MSLPGRAAAGMGMGFWSERVVPALIELAMRSERLRPLRHAVVAAAHGRVLELGIGSGLNLPFYGREVREVVGVDPSERLLFRARRRAAWMPFDVRLIRQSAEHLPLAEASIDCAVSSWCLCSIPEPLLALGEVRRVLKPGGAFLFVEHGLSPEPRVARWQRRLTPLWCRLAGGCRLDRPMDRLVREAGFTLERLETGHLVPGPRLLTYHYVGVARR